MICASTKHSSHQGESLWNWLGDADLWNNLGFSLCAILSICHVVAISDGRKKSGKEVSTDWYVAVKHQRLSSIRIIFINY